MAGTGVGDKASCVARLVQKIRTSRVARVRGRWVKVAVEMAVAVDGCEPGREAPHVVGVEERGRMSEVEVDPDERGSPIRQRGIEPSMQFPARPGPGRRRRRLDESGLPIAGLVDRDAKPGQAGVARRCTRVVDADPPFESRRRHVRLASAARAAGPTRRRASRLRPYTAAAAMTIAASGVSRVP